MILFFPAPAHAQNDYLMQTGVPTFTTAEPAQLGFVNVANGNLHLEAPLTSPPQRGSLPFSAKFIYDSRIWQIVNNGSSQSWQPASNGGWQYTTTAGAGTFYYSTVATFCGGSNYYETFYPFYWTDPDGTQHTFPITTQENFGCSGVNNITSGDAFAQDSSGYHMYVTAWVNAVVYAKDGTEVYPALKDPNGNSEGGPIGQDTLGRNLVTVTNNAYYDVLNSQGSTSRFTVYRGSINVCTNFGVYGVTEYSGTVSVISDIDLPDGTAYHFTYDSTPDPNQCINSPFYGEVTQVQLPAGGNVQYTYRKFSDSYGSMNHWVSTRAAGGGTWTYSLTASVSCPPGSGFSFCQTTTVTKPSADQTVYTFGLFKGAWNVQTDYYTGSVSPTNKLMTVTNAYNFPSGYVQLASATTSLPSAGGATLTKQVTYTYDSPQASNVTAIKEWNYYTGSPPASPDRETDFTYLTSSAYTGKNIINLVTDKIVKNSSGAQVAETKTTYDSTALTLVTGVVNHDDTNFGTGNTVRGNPTLVQRWVSGSTYLATTSYYDTTGQVTKVTDPKENNTTFRYSDNFFSDNGANPPSAYTPATPTNAYVTSVTLPVSGSRTSGYYYNTGKLAVSTDQNGASSYQHYLDSLDRLTHTYTPPVNGNPGWTLTQYTSATQRDVYSSLNSTSPSSGCTSCRHDQAALDGLGRVVTTTLASDPDGATHRDTAYDSSSRTQSVSNPYRSTSDPTYGLETPSYDGLNRITQVTHADGTSVQTFYGAAVSSGGGIASQLCASGTYGLGFPVLGVDEAGKKRQTWSDGFGRSIEVDEPDASGNLTVGTCYRYDGLNNLIEVDQGSQTRTYAYDGLSRLTSSTTPESGASNLYYTTSGGALCAGNPKAVCRSTDARSITTTHAYDALSRLSGKSYSNGDPAVSYFCDQTSYNGLTITNGQGRRTGMSDASGITAWSYDAAGHVLTEKRTNNNVTRTTSYSYNLDGSLASLTYPSGRTITNTYSNALRPVSAVDTGNSINYALSASYAPPGELASVLEGQASGFTGLTATYGYNNRLQLVTAKATSTNGTVLDLAFGYAAGANNGDVTSVTNNRDNTRSQSYTYDPLNRLSTAQSQATSGANCWGQSLGYDRYANLTTITSTQCSSPTLSLSINGNNQITNPGVTYDAAGNLANDGLLIYNWNAEERLSSTAGVTYTYDGDGRRMEKSNGTLYWYSVTGEVLAKTDLSGNVIMEFVYFGGRHLGRRAASGSVYYLFGDHLGSGRVMTDATGHTQQESDYYPFGGERVITNTVDNRYKFTGKERDSESGLDHSLFRQYSSTLGRWLSPDPKGGHTGNPQSLNRYAYVENEPCSATDPLGLLLVSEGCTAWLDDEANVRETCSGQFALLGQRSTFFQWRWRPWLSDTSRNQLLRGTQGLPELRFANDPESVPADGQGRSADRRTAAGGHRPGVRKGFSANERRPERDALGLRRGRPGYGAGHGYCGPTIPCVPDRPAVRDSHS